LSGANANIGFGSAATFNNNGTFLAQNDQSLFYTGGTASVFNNAGIFTRDTTTGIFTIGGGVILNNTGTVNVNNGTLRLNGGDTGTTTGDFNVASGATLDINSNFTFAASSDLAGAGTIIFDSGTQVLNGTYTLSALNLNGSTLTSNIALSLSTLNVNGGSLTANQSVDVSGLFTWNGGTLTGNGPYNANGGILINTDGVSLSGATLNNATGQTTTLSGANANIGFGSAATFNNNGTFLAQNDQSLFYTGGAASTFNNAGTFTRDTGTGTFTVGGSVAFNNSGIVNANSGTLAFNGGFTQTAGTTQLNGGNITASNALNIQGGLLTGSGTITAGITNGGTLRPALGGALNVTGNVSLLSSSNLSFQLGGLTQGTQYSFLNVNGTVALSGNLVLSFANGFENSVTGSNTFTLMNSTGLTGSFTNIASGSRLDTSDGFGSFLVTYNGTSLTLSGFLPAMSEFGPPQTITSPNPYVISSGTSITTDPTITTGGVPNSGKIYRNLATDGAFSVWAFGATSAFDTALNLDSEFFNNPANVPLAVFKFQSLVINGNPTVDVTGGPTNLGLIGVDGISSGPIGGALTFTGLNGLYLGTVNGSINLTSGLSFQGLNTLAMYARGAGSDLTINSPITNIGDLALAAEHSISLTNAGTMSLGAFNAMTGGGDQMLQVGSLLLDGKMRLKALIEPGASVASGGNLTLNITQDLTNDSATEFSQLTVTNAQGHIGTGGNINVTVGGNLTATGPGSMAGFQEPGDFIALVQNTNGQIDNGGNLNLTVNGSVQVNGLDAEVQNYDFSANPAGHIGTGGNIDIEVGGDLIANHYLEVRVNNRGGGAIDSGGNLTLNVTGTLTVGAEAVQTVISNRYDDSGGNTTGSSIGSDVQLLVHAASVNFTGTTFDSDISNRGSVLNGNATETWNITNALTIQNESSLEILNEAAADVDAITPQSGGMLNGNATLTLNVGGDASFGSDVFFEIGNSRISGATGKNGGTITGNAVMNVFAGSLSVDGELDALIENEKSGASSGNAGVIGGDATINFTLTHDLTLTGTSGTGLADIEILNQNGGSIGGKAAIALAIPGAFSAVSADFEIFAPNGANIGSDASIDVHAGSFSVSDSVLADNPLLVAINNNSGSHIGFGTGTGSALINFVATGIVSSQSSAQFSIDNSGSGAIAGEANLAVSASSITTANVVTEAIFNQSGGSIGGNATVNLNLTGGLSTGARLSLGIGNNDGGHIGGDANISAVIDGNVNTFDLSVGIQDYNSGVINGGGGVSLTVNGSLTVGENTEPMHLFVNTFNGGSINNGGNITASIGVDMSTGNVSSGIQNQIGGTIQNGGNFGLSVGGNLTTASGTDLNLFINNSNSGFIGTGGNLTFSVGQDLSTNNLSVGVSNNDNGKINNGGNVTVNVAGDLIAAQGVNFYLTNYNGGTLGSTSAVGLDVSVSGALNSGAGGALFQLQNENGGAIAGDANLAVSASSITTAGNFTETINNQNGGTIGGQAAISLNLSGSLMTTAGGISLQILNQNASGHGMIGSDASVSLIASNISTPGAFNVNIFNNFVATPIHGNASVTVNAGAVTTGTAGADPMTDLNVGITNIFGTIDKDATVVFHTTGDVNTQGGNAFFQIQNGEANSGSAGGVIGMGAKVDLLTQNLTVSDSLTIGVDNTASSITNNVDVLAHVVGSLNAGDTTFGIFNSDDGAAGTPGTIGGHALISAIVDGDLSVSSLTGIINDRHAGSIGDTASIGLSVGGAITVSNSADPSSANLQWGVSTRNDGSGGGTIGSDVTSNLSASSISTDGFMVTFVSTNGGGHIMGDASNNVTLTGDLLAQQGLSIQIESTGFNSANPLNFIAGGKIDGNAFVNLSALNITSNSTASGNLDPSGDGPSIAVYINDNGSGSIGGVAHVTVNASGDITSAGSAFFGIANGNFMGFGPGSIGGEAVVNVSAANINVGPLFADIYNHEASIGDKASISLSISNNVTLAGAAQLLIDNSGGMVISDAGIGLTAVQFSAPSMQVLVNNTGGGNIGGNASLNLQLTGDMNVTGGDSFFDIENDGGSIGGNSSQSISANNISASGYVQVNFSNTNGGSVGAVSVSLSAARNVTTGDFLENFVFNDNGLIAGGVTGSINIVGTANVGTNTFIGMSNQGGTIDSSAAFDLTTGSLTTAQFLSATVNNMGGTVVGDVSMNISSTNITASNIVVSIDNSSGGMIDGAASITSTVSGTVNATSNATYQILGSDGASSATINFNGGDYEVGGTFLAKVDASGAMTFSNVTAHADTVKIGVLGTNGTLTIGGGSISADTLMRIYAPGSNGVIDFIHNVTLSSNSVAVVIAANTVTIENGVVVTINGTAGAALVYVNGVSNANYDVASGGNGSTTGMFAGNGATTHPLSDAPDFDTGATPTPAPTPDKFGPPTTITSPNPYIIDGTTMITTDPGITTGGNTDFGKIYRDFATDGSRTDWLFEATSTFDTDSGFEGGVDTSTFLNQIAVFKFQNLNITGGPTISTAGGVTSLGLVGVDGITTSGPGGTFDLTGIDSFLLATENGSITLGSDVGFINANRMFIYARGLGSNLTIASPISTNDDLRLYSEGTVTINNNLSTLNFSSYSGGDFLGGMGNVSAAGIFITSQNGSITFNAAHFNPGALTNIALSLNAANIINIDVTADQQVFAQATSIDVHAGSTLNINGNSPTVLDLSNAPTASFTAGTGGINAGSVEFKSPDLTLFSDADINVFGVDLVGGSLAGTITANGSFSSASNVTTGDLTATNGSVFVNGDLFVSNVTAGTTIGITGQLRGFGTATAGGNITANQIEIPNIQAPNGVLTAGSGGIVPFIVIFGPGDGAFYQHTFNVDSIVSPNGINFNGNQFDLTTNPGPGGLLTINARTLTFDVGSGIGNVNFNGADNGAFGGAQVNGGDGGNFQAITTGNIVANNGTDILATTGLNSSSGVFSGNGGTIRLQSTGGTVSVDDVIRVSSDSAVNQRQSANGGTLIIESGLTSGPGINIGGDTQLLSRLNVNAPGSGGAITLVTFGSDINIQSGAFIAADRGDLSIANSGGPSFSQINIDGATLTSETLSISSTGTINVGSSHPTSVSAVTVNIFTTGILNWVSPLSLPDIGSASNGGVQIIADNTMFFGSDVDIARSSGDTDGGMNVTFSAGTGGLSIGGHLSVALSPNLIDTGGNISISSQQDINVMGDVTLSTTVMSDLMSGGNILVSAAPFSSGNLTTNSLAATITNNSGVTIGDNLNLTLTAGDIVSTMSGDLDVGIVNHGTINGAATITINATTLTSNSALNVAIDNSDGSITGAATINLNVAGAANAGTNATVEILGSDAAGSAAINFNGADYTVSGTLLAMIDGSGTISLNTASIHADVVKVGVLGTNGTLTVGGGSITADTLLKLYAPGSNGVIDFVADVTLTSNGTAVVIAANTVTIENGKVVTISGSAGAALVYNNVGNYDVASGGNGSTTGMFAGNGVTTHPLSEAPGFNAPTWIGSSGNWSDATQWDSNPRYPNNGQPSAGDVYDAILANGGTINLDVPITIQNFLLSNGSITGSNNLTINDEFVWSGGTLGTGGITNANGGIVFAGGAVTLNSGTLNNASGQMATMSASGATLTIGNGAVFNNNGTFLAQKDNPGAGFSILGANGVFNNTGTFTRDTTNGFFFIGSQFNNSGVVNVNTGTLGLIGSYLNPTTGSFNVAAGATLLVSGSYDFAAGSSIAGAGTVDFGADFQTIEGNFNMVNLIIHGSQTTFNVPISIGSFDFDAGILSSSQTVDIAGLFTWNGGGFGTITGGATVNANGGITFNDGTAVLDGSTVNNAMGQIAALSFPAVVLDLQNGGTFNNNGIFLAEADTPVGGESITSSTGGGMFVNNGTFTRDTGSGTFTIGDNVVFQNDGTVNVESGTLLIKGGDGGATTGTFNISNGATLEIADHAIGQVSGAINLNNGTLTVDVNSHAYLFAGTLGTINATSAFITSVQGINFNGINADELTVPTHGGSLTFNTSGISFDPSGTIQGTITFNGGDGFEHANMTLTPGQDGGTFTVNSTGSIAVDSDIEATTGNEPAGITQSGAGGTVNLNSSGGEVLVRGRIEVSSNDANRRSATGGFINIESDVASGPAVDIEGTGQLLALLGPPTGGGSITILATGGSSEMDIKGTIEADAGTVDIRQTGTNGLIVMQDAVSSFTLRGDIVKIGALGNNGVLNIGQGTISADTILKLYAGGSNGTINFNNSVTLDGNSAKIIAANTINIFNGITLTINGPTPADIYTNNANYAVANGGNGVHTGTIAGTAGANAPQPLSSAPGFGAPGVPNGITTAPSGTTGPAASPTPSGIGTSPAGHRGPKPPIADAGQNNDKNSTTVNVTDTNQLRDLIDNATSGATGNTHRGMGRSNRKSSREKRHRTDNRPGDGLPRNSQGNDMMHGVPGR
jgi:hypothetical protein